MASILARAGERLATWSIRGGGVLMFAAALVIALDVVLRKVFHVTLGGADELAGYALAIGSAWSYSAVLLRRGNVRVDALYRLLPGVLRYLLDLLAVAALGAIAAVFAWYGYDVLTTSWELASRSNSDLKVPLWIPQLLWWAGLTQFALTAALLLLRAAAALAKGDRAGFEALVGARSIEEDAAGEAVHARQHEGEMLHGGAR